MADCAGAARGVPRGVPLRAPCLPVHADAERVFAQQIKNAHGRGGVGLREAAEPGEERFRFVVEDPGYGAAAGDLPHGTRRFCRTPEGRKRGVSGPGLGLVITREPAGLHGSTRHLGRAFGAGTTLVFLLPSPASPDGPPLSARPHDLI